MLYLVGASSENDLSILLREHGINYTPADTLSMLLDTLTAGDAVICPADNYPSGNATIITQSELDFSYGQRRSSLLGVSGIRTRA